MNRTKQMIIEQFSVLLEEKPYTDITVRDIVERCGINRNTFYYHFEGIPSLLMSTIENRADEIIAAHSHLESPLDCVQPLIQLITENKQSVFHIYRSMQRDIFIDSLDRIVMHIVEQYINTISQGTELKQEGKLLLIRFYKCFIVGTVLDWLQHDLKYDMSYMLKQMEPYFAEARRQAFLGLAT